MTSRIVLLPRAQRDLLNAVVAAEERRTGAGDRLTDEIERRFERLAANPYVGPALSTDLRKLVLRRFPYTLIYQVLPSRVLVRAIMHHRRKPESWRDAL